MGQVLYSRASAGGMFLLQALQNKTGYHQDILS
jgi:hypothetical protein